MPMTASERVKKSRMKNDCIAIRPPLEKGKQIREAAEKVGEPLTIFIMKAIEARLEAGW